METEELEFVCDKIVEKKTKKKDDTGRMVNAYSTIVKCKSIDLNDAGKPMHKMSIETDHPIEPGDELTISFTSKQTKLENLAEEIESTPHAKEIVQAQLDMLSKNEKTKKRSHHKKKD